LSQRFSCATFTHKKRFGSVRNEGLFVKFIKSVFRYRNKNLRNAMLKAYPFIAEDIKISREEFLNIPTLGKNADKKTTLVSVEEFVEIFNRISRG